MAPQLNLSRRQFLSATSLAMGAVILDQFYGDSAQAMSLAGTEYLIGVGKGDITDPAIGLGMQGMADKHQRTTGVESRLYAKAFIVVDPASMKRVAIASTDLWSGTHIVKHEVLQRLHKIYGPDLYQLDNLLISGTHTHSGPGGYCHYYLYNHSLGGPNKIGGFDRHNFECIVSGIVAAIQQAHHRLAPGKIYVNQGQIEDCGRQRSPAAYQQNPGAERKQYGSDTDHEMLLLKFVHLNGTIEKPIGLLNWYAIHPTDHGQYNTRVTGDNKGDAAERFEDKSREPIVAAFANANCGDVSGNVAYGSIPTGINDRERMQKHGQQQYQQAQTLFDQATEALQGSIDYRHTFIDLSHIEIADQPGKRTWPAALGLSFAAGSSEDSDPPFQFREGITVRTITKAESTILAASGLIAAMEMPGADLPGHLDRKLTQDFIDGHAPKPIAFAPGLAHSTTDYHPITPQEVPIQILKIGNLVLTGIPGEITTMAGRRLRATVQTELKADYLALATYANAFSQYITTLEEYQAQHYEGASTLYGPYTLMAYQQEFRKLALAMKRGQPVSPGAVPQAPDPKIMLPRVTFRNLAKIVIKPTFHQHEKSPPLKLASLKLPPETDVAWMMPKDYLQTGVVVKFDGASATKVSVNSLVTIHADRSIEVSSYRPSTF
ncbi:neutral/alkaline non-lysosomal ceramidase N-terminal domain-containing protein [Acaryochloris marina NIES-2412]|uniref:neutral/alkaline non-lysosomal ceramidase N-terminal domain-containing protein n=1 Tax=Acaryochloris marina TaxID=155978 RepID=UPI00405816F1